MASIDVKEAESGLSGLVDCAASGEFITITRHGKPEAVLVSVEAAAAKLMFAKDCPSLVAHLKRFPADVDLDDEVFARNRQPSREIKLRARLAGFSLKLAMQPHRKPARQEAGESS